MISIRNVRKRFGDTEAVAGLSLEIATGEIFGIVGPDGAGKSTLLRMISTILAPNEGAVEIDGVNVFENPYRIKDHLAYMPQRFGLYEDLTVEENLVFFGRLFGVTRREIRSRMKRLYQFSRLEPFRDRLAGNLSGGMKQKLGLACSLIHNPRVILLDEPTNGVDPVSRREFWNILYELLSDGVTIVVSTAYLDEAERCNRIALMFNGGIVVTGRPGEIKRSIGRRFVAFTTSDPRHSEEALREVPEFEGVILTGNTLHVFVDSVAAARRRIVAHLRRKRIRVLSFKETLPGLEDCFVDIVARGGRSA
ncbi:MAG TPA: ABC transporter ATP-binding protein [Spirochaetota bacterium]|nr:ABC transporter ATP-binding protein [Spirochaetota bacterium]HNT10406.1 ABC transporter ATP-binding protein [Spirochaetota bacterium]HNV46452.1 ABC transporter ATP-binding protein [Spirochaetota bacterium]HPI23334.1 ABC transporter ATP-binding protein [Spirochaetota bacterium]HPU86968.1 ABC transporter ATP-binding protein [Spirochaetota bacterium]